MAEDEQRQTLLSAAEQAAAATIPTSTKAMNGDNTSDSHQRSLLARALPFMAFHFLIAFAELVLVAPLLSLFEHSLCVMYYAGTTSSSPSIAPWSLDEARCKIPAIQQELAIIRGWKSSLDTLPVFLVAIPIGKLADRLGRRRLLAVNLVSVVCAYAEIMLVCAFPFAFPLRLVWASSLILLFGGGLYATAALMWAMVAAAFGEEDRSRAMYYVFSAFYVAELIASALASITMQTSAWIGCVMSVSALLLAFCLLPALPDSSSTPVSEATEEETSPGRSKPILETGLATFREAISNSNVRLAIPAFLVGGLRYTVLNILMQYTSICFGWPLSQTALIYTETAIVTTVLFLFIVPAGTFLLNKSRYGVPAATLDLGMARTSFFLLSLGAFFIASSSTSTAVFASVLVYAAGFGSRVALLSLLSRWTSDGSKGGFYAAVAVLENIGHAVGDPSLQRIFAATLGKDQDSGWGQALPFVCASAMYCVAFLFTLAMRGTLNGNSTSSRSHLA